MIPASRIVLVVEDSEECGALLEIALSTIPGLAVRVVASAELALDMIDTADVAAVITDLHLPGLDGLDLVTLVRRHARCADVPILVISGDADPGTPERVRVAGASAFFAKPYSPVGMRAKLEELIHAR